MKRPLIVWMLALAAAVAVAPSAPGQQEAPRGIKVTSTLHDDGTRTDMQVDYDSLTAESKTYNASKKLIQRVTYTTDDQGKLLEGVIYNAKEQVTGRVAYTYDDQGRMQEQMDLSPKGDLIRRLVYHYNAQGRVSGIDAYDAKGNLMVPSGDGPQKKRPRPPVRR